MTDLQPGLTRRALLGAGVLIVAGCRSRSHDAAASADSEAVASARAGELSLLSSYAEGTPDHTAHLAHLRALGGTVPTPGSAASPGVPPAYTDARSSVAALQAAAVGARSGATAATLASIAASHAVLAAPRP